MKIKALTKELNQLLDQGRPLLKKLPPTGINITQEMSWYREAAKNLDMWGPKKPIKVTSLTVQYLQEDIKTARAGLAGWRKCGELP